MNGLVDECKQFELHDLGQDCHDVQVFSQREAESSEDMIAFFSILGTSHQYNNEGHDLGSGVPVEALC